MLSLTVIFALLTGSASYSQPALPFVENQGQLEESVSYYARTFSGTVFVTQSGEIVYALPGCAGEAGWAVRECLVSGQLEIPSGESRVETKVSILKGDDEARWLSRIPAYGVVNLGEVYDGIGLKLKAHGDNVEKIFHVAPGADPLMIRVRVDGVQELKVLESGELEALTALGPVTYTAPRAWQEGGGSVEIEYDVQGCEYGFVVSPYDRDRTLFIDPLLASTFAGGVKADCSWAVELDGAGNVIVAGVTASPAFPTTPGSFDESHNGGSDLFVSKYDPSLKVLLASTFIGGSAAEEPNSLAVRPDGSVYVAGSTTSSDFPVTAGAYDTSSNGGSDAFVALLNPDLSTLVSSTYLGGTGNAGNICVRRNPVGDLFVFGWTSSTDFPVTAGAYSSTYNGGSPVYGQGGDLFASLLGADLDTLLASTYLGGSGCDISRRMALDKDGNLFCTGLTASADFPITPGAYESTHKGGNTFGGDIYVSKLDSGLSNLLASTFIGSVKDDWGISIVVDETGHVYVTGDAFAADYPTTPNAYDRTFHGGTYGDCIISRFDGELKTLLASTFIGGTGSEWNTDIRLGPTGDVFAAGLTTSTEFPTTAGAYDETHNGQRDVHVVRLDKDLTTIHASTLIGGSARDWPMSMTVSSSGDVYVTGGTASNNFPATPWAYDDSYNGGTEDGFIIKLDSQLSANPALMVGEEEVSAVSGGTVDFNLTAGESHANRNYLVLGSLSGTSPGYALPGGLATLPLNWDAFTDLMLLFINTPVFANFLGTLDKKGGAFAQINAPPLPGFGGTIMYYAYALNNPFDFASNAVEIEIAP